MGASQFGKYISLTRQNIVTDKQAGKPTSEADLKYIVSGHNHP